jgi:hypothetical protein
MEGLYVEIIAWDGNCENFPLNFQPVFHLYSDVKYVEESV